MASPCDTLVLSSQLGSFIAGQHRSWEIHQAPLPSLEVEPISFDYSDGERGPAHWGDLMHEWSLCKTGIAQSPLAITANVMITDPNLGELDATYTSKPVNATISHAGHAIQVDVPPNTGLLRIFNVSYRPKQFHFHSPSEHQVLGYSWRWCLNYNQLWLLQPTRGERGATDYIPGTCSASPSNSGTSPFLKIIDYAWTSKVDTSQSLFKHRNDASRFPLELHLVQQSADNKTAVISILYVYGVDNPFLAQFFDKLPSHTNLGAKTDVGPIKLPKLEHSYGLYRGSLTTPPCTEKVMWTIMLWNWPTVSDYQLQQLRAVMPTDNARTTSFPSRGRRFHINHTPKWMLEKLNLDILLSKSS